LRTCLCVRISVIAALDGVAQGGRPHRPLLRRRPLRVDHAGLERKCAALLRLDRRPRDERVDALASRRFGARQPRLRRPWPPARRLPLRGSGAHHGPASEPGPEFPLSSHDSAAANRSRYCRPARLPSRKPARRAARWRATAQVLPARSRNAPALSVDRALSFIRSPMRSTWSTARSAAPHIPGTSAARNQAALNCSGTVSAPISRSSM